MNWTATGPVGQRGPNRAFRLATPAPVALPTQALVHLRKERQSREPVGMNVERSSQNEIWDRRNEFHCLTYAEEGFSPLNIWTRGIGISKEELVEFADLVNRRDEPGSLYPRAPVSAVPRRLIRDQRDPDFLRESIEQFLQANATSIRATKVILDFRTPKVAPFVERAIDMCLQSPGISLIEELIVIRD